MKPFGFGAKQEVPLLRIHPKDEKELNGAVNMRAAIINATVVTLIPSIS